MKSIGKKKCLNDKKNSFKMMHKARKKQDKMMKNGFFYNHGEFLLEDLSRFQNG